MTTDITPEILCGAGFGIHTNGFYALDVKAELPLLENINYANEDPNEFAVILSIRNIGHTLVMDMVVISNIFNYFDRKVIRPTCLEEIRDFLKAHGLPKAASRFDVFIKQ